MAAHSLAPSGAAILTGMYPARTHANSSCMADSCVISSIRLNQSAIDFDARFFAGGNLLKLNCSPRSIALETSVSIQKYSNPTSDVGFAHTEAFGRHSMGKGLALMGMYPARNHANSSCMADSCVISSIRLSA